MKECTRVRSNTTPEVEWTEADSKIREIEWRNPFGFFFLPPGTVKEPKHRLHITITVSEIEKEPSSRKRRRLFATAIGGTL